MLEQRGLATTVIALVLAQVEKTRPPRALMTPFMLGRPLGEPNDAAFQRRVLLQALQLLTRDDGPVLLEHFEEVNPSWFDRPGWRPAPELPALVMRADAAEWRVAFADELACVMPAWQRFAQRFGRSSVGLGGQPVEAWAAFAVACLDGGLPTVAAHATSALALRFLADDIKAMYGEAAQADGGPPSARQIDTWFWRETVAGQLLIALRAAALLSPNNAMKAVGGRFLVPAPFVPV